MIIFFSQQDRGHLVVGNDAGEANTSPWKISVRRNKRSPSHDFSKKKKKHLIADNKSRAVLFTSI